MLSLSFVLWNGLTGCVLPKNSRSLIGWTAFPLGDNGFCRGLFHNKIDFFSQWFKFQHLHTSIVDSLNLTLTEWKTKKRRRKGGANKYLPISPRENALGNLFSVQELAMPTRRGMDYVTQHEPCTIHPKPFVTQLWIERNWVTKIT
jgi:hypothetical protein